MEWGLSGVDGCEGLLAFAGESSEGFLNGGAGTLPSTVGFSGAELGCG